MSPYKKLIVYYFTGTGNSLNVARWLSNVAKADNIQTEIVNISLADRRNIEPPEPGSLILFVSPIHGFNYPPVMVHFIMRFPKANNSVVLMNTRAGMLIGKLITPGLTGIAFYLSALLLKLKGYSVRAMLPVDLPSNWISVHPGLNEKTVKYLHEKNREKVYSFANTILSGKSSFKPLREIVQDLLIMPVAVLYYFIGRFIFAKTYYASADCNNCNICIKECPVKGVIKVANRPYWTFNCESCMKCMSYCPKKAIETAHGSIIGFSLLFSLVFLAVLHKYLNMISITIDNQLIKILVESVLFLSLLAIWYRITHFLMRFRLFERLMVYTSLTKLKWWGRRYKALND
jgi:ferredoxin